MDFARQLAERNASHDSTAIKKFRSAPAPKGTKLGPGYQDRTQFRTSIDDDEKARRVKALEDMVKLGQMEIATFEALRDEIVGGDVKHVHLVKGLDWKLLERVRRGEDVLGDSPTSNRPDDMIHTPTEGYAATEVQIEDELERLEGKTILPVAKNKNIKKGEMAPPVTVAGKKRNRDEILKELKASRLASARLPSLGPRFTKLGEAKEKSRIEKDDRGRDILITVDKDGKVKRKVRKTQSQPDSTNDRGLLMPDKDAKPLGMNISPTAPLAPEISDDGDIFEGVGAEYNPLGDVKEDSGDSDTSDSPRAELGDSPVMGLPPTDQDPNPTPWSIPPEDPSKAMSDPLPPQFSLCPRNYFNDSAAPPAATQAVDSKILEAPTLLAALKKAATCVSLSAVASEEEAAKLERRRKMLDSHDRDVDDLDMGFGESRFEDGEDGDGGKVKLSVWGEEAGEDGESKKGKRKRGGKKRKGDGNSAVDVLRVMEKRKAEARARTDAGTR
jgi:hypothetical protein